MHIHHRKKIYVRFGFAVLLLIASGGAFLAGSYYQKKIAEEKFETVVKTKELLKTENEQYRQELSEIRLHLTKLKSLEDKLIDIFGLKNTDATRKPAAKSAAKPSAKTAKKNGVGGPEVSQRTEVMFRNELLTEKSFYHKDAAKLYFNILRKEEVFSEINDYINTKKTNFKNPMFVYTLMPANGKINSNYGTRMDPLTEEVAFHEGIDISANYWTPVRAVSSGKVTLSGWDSSGYGKMVIIDHGRGYSTVYGHNCTTIVKPNEVVKKGEVIAYVGNTGRSTGPHLHFEVRYNGRSFNPLNYYYKRG
ncbi:MAG: peptidoglycan DD-metalloendopeptidase family protein [Candidatus Schekmanbacteria bacterium]|nr:peptidoglycan DD-metalloendopeptidase family protein [Candidatus Schekmanbacteria bacterium]